VTECVFNVLLDKQQVILETKSFQSIDCTGTDNQTVTKRNTYTKHKIMNQTHINWPPYKHKQLILKQSICKNCSYQLAYDCVQVCCTM